MNQLTKIDYKTIKNNIKARKINNKCYCEICNDKEVLYQVDDRGLPINLTPCPCVKRKRDKSVIEKSGLKDKMQLCTFDNFNAYNENLIFAKKLAENFVDEKHAKALLLLGKSGTGKTHLATATAVEIINKYAESLIFINYRELIQPLKALTLELDERYKYINKFKNIQILYIDDLFKGMDFKNSTERQYIYEIIDYRYSRNKKTIITCEYTTQELLKIDEAIIGRLGEMADGYIVEMKNVNNYRAMKIKENRVIKFKELKRAD